MLVGLDYLYNSLAALVNELVRVTKVNKYLDSPKQDSDYFQSEMSLHLGSFEVSHGTLTSG